MAVYALDLASLMEQLDGGRVAEAFDAELRRVVMDCEDRPADDKERKVVLTFQIKPVVDDSGHLDEVKGRFQVTSTVPRRRSKIYSFGARKNGVLVFNDLSDDNINQGTIE